eukprot:6405951-Ditylum_brightwellii.AAC.1
MDDSTGLQVHFHLSFLFEHGAPGAINHPNQWTPKIRYKFSQCDSQDPTAFGSLVGLHINLHRKAKTELDDLTWWLYREYNDKMADDNRADDFLTFCCQFRTFACICSGGLMSYLYGCTKKWGQQLAGAIMGRTMTPVWRSWAIHVHLHPIRPMTQKRKNSGDSTSIISATSYQHTSQQQYQA